MNQVYVIVLEVDNVRAAKAYAKGLADLDEIYDQLLIKAAQRDAERNALMEAEKAVQAAKEAYYESIGKLIHFSDRPFHFMFPYKSRSVFCVQDIRLQLEGKKKMAEMAISSFRLTESDVHMMIRWEDGSEVEYLKDIYLGIKTIDKAKTVVS